jgi:hypothetical protein
VAPQLAGCSSREPTYLLILTTPSADLVPILYFPAFSLAHFALRSSLLGFIVIVAFLLACSPGFPSCSALCCRTFKLTEH